MLASETKDIANYIKKNVELVYGEGKDSFADTRDSLCYATNDNQSATFGLMEQSADLAIVVGGYNSSNTTHLAELCEEKYPTYFINSDDKILSDKEISHFNFHTETELISKNYLPKKEVVEIIITSGASCPDALVDKVLQKLLSYFPDSKSVESVINDVTNKYQN
jgi:4-hydroxy-3-methylbut-2-enyl diphosphate reductase